MSWKTPHTRLRRITAFVLALVFLQAILGDFFHIGHTEHFYCPEHQQLTHDREHAEAVHATYASAHAVVERHGMATTHSEPGHDDHSDSPLECEALQWISNGGVPVNDALQAALAERATTLDLVPRSVYETQIHPNIDMRFHASGLSPPV